MFRLFITCALSCVTTIVASANAEPATLVYSVRPGDSLGRIARKHDVSIDAICRAGARDRTQKIYPGDKLIIPARGSAPARGAERADVRLLVNADAVLSAHADALARGDEPQRAQLLRAKPPPSSSPSSSLRLDASLWRRYVRAPRQRGLVSLRGHGRNFIGIAKMSEQHVSDETRRAFGHVLFNHRNGEEAEIAGRLVRLLVQVSDTFGGRPINVVSGYRDTSFAMESRHLHGAACDFSIEGVPNLALFAVLSSLAHVGVGYYPNSSFVHLDVRATKATWVDLAGPGEPPRYVDAKRYFTTSSVALGDQ